MNPNLPAKWFRMYAEFATDPKVQMLSEPDQRRFVMLLCLRCASGSKPPQDSEVCFQLRISDAEWSKSKSTLRSLDLIDGSNRPVAWDKRQYVSDCSTERVYKYRRNVSETFQKRPQSQSTETEAKSEKTNGQKPPAPHHPFALIWNENCGTLPAIEKLTPGRLR